MSTPSPTTYVTQGPGHLYVATFGATLPTDASISSLLAGTFTGFVYAGDTETAVELSDAPNYVNANSQQQGRTIASAIDKLVTTVKTTVIAITEANLVNLCRGTISTESGVDTITPGGIGQVTYHSIAVVGPWPGGQALFVAERCGFRGAQTLGFDSTKFSSIPIEFEVFLGSTLPNDYVTYIPTPS